MELVGSCEAHIGPTISKGACELGPTMLAELGFSPQATTDLLSARNAPSFCFFLFLTQTKSKGS